MDRRTLRRLFMSAFRSEGLTYVGGGAQIEHPDLTWSLSLIVDGFAATAPYRVVLGVSLAQLGPQAPREAEDCYLFLPLAYGDRSSPQGGPPCMPDAAFPEWTGSDADRATTIGALIKEVVQYARGVDSLDHLRARYTAGDFAGAFIIAPMRSLLAAHE